MPKKTRSAIVESGRALSGGALTFGRGVTDEAACASTVKIGPHLTPEQAAILVTASSSNSPQQRALLDFDWRFHLGNASDYALDFGFGSPGRERLFAKANFVGVVGDRNFDDSKWRPVA